MATKRKANQPKPKPQAKKAAAKSQQKAKPARASQPSPKNKPASKPITQTVAGMAKGVLAAAFQRMSALRTPSLPPLSSVLSRSTPSLSSGSPTDGGVRYLTVQDVIEIHRAVSVEFGGTQSHPGVVESQFGLLNAVQRPQVTTLGREAYPSFPDKVAAFVFALLSYRPFRGGNRRLALASIVAFCELNDRTLDSRVFDEKTAEGVIRRVASHRESGVAPENAFREIKETLMRAIVAQ